jgi:hypothetical protein
VFAGEAEVIDFVAGGGEGGVVGSPVDLIIINILSFLLIN